MHIRPLLVATVAAFLLALSGVPVSAQDTASAETAAAASAEADGCYGGFVVRHSYLVREEQYAGDTITFPFGDGITTAATYNRAFIMYLKETGSWGMTKNGKYLQKSASAEDPGGKKIWRLVDANPVEDGTVATNRLDLYPIGSKISIDDGPTLLVNSGTERSDKNLLVVWTPDNVDSDNASVCRVP
jgi:hypothetical protein